MSANVLLAIVAAAGKVMAWYLGHTTVWLRKPGKAAEWAGKRKGKVWTTKWDATPTPQEWISAWRRFCEDPMEEIGNKTMVGEAEDVRDWIASARDQEDARFTACDADDDEFPAVLKEFWLLITDTHREE